MSILNAFLSLADLPPSPQSGWLWTKQSNPLSKKLDSLLYPRISIITPSYNQGEFIEATIRSVLLQGYPNLEYIIIDGGSTDGTVDVIKKYESQLAYWVSEPDAGQADAINKGIKQSSGEILSWINSDDLYVKGSFAKVVKAFRAHPDCTLVHGNRLLVDRAGKLTGWIRLSAFDPTTSIYNICSETVFWKRAAMDKVGLLDANLKFAMDLEFFGRLYQQGTFLKLNEYLGCFRCYPENKTASIADIGRAEAQREWRKLFESDLNLEADFNDSVMNKLLTLIKHPKLIAFPYLLHRLTKYKARHLR